MLVSALVTALPLLASTRARGGGEFTEVFRTAAAADDSLNVDGHGPYACAWAPALIELNASLLLLFYEGRTGNCSDEGGRTDLLYKRSTGAA